MRDVFEGSGWTKALAEADVAPSDKNDSFLTAAHLTRTKHANLVTLLALHNLKKEASCRACCQKVPVLLLNWHAFRRWMLSDQRWPDFWSSLRNNIFLMKKHACFSTVSTKGRVYQHRKPSMQNLDGDLSEWIIRAVLLYHIFASFICKTRSLTCSNVLRIMVNQSHLKSTTAKSLMALLSSTACPLPASVPSMSMHTAYSFLTWGSSCKLPPDWMFYCTQTYMPDAYSHLYTISGPGPCRLAAERLTNHRLRLWLLLGFKVNVRVFRVNPNHNL